MALWSSGSWLGSFKGVKGLVVLGHAGEGTFLTADEQTAVIESFIKSVKGKIPVFVDGGIRNGTDVVKALALGAKGVFIGRPVLYGLTCGGREGVKAEQEKECVSKR